MTGFAAVIFAANLMFVLLITAVEAVCYRVPGLYEREFIRYRVQEELLAWRGETMELTDLTAVMEETLQYLRGRREDLVIEVPVNGENTEFYNETEKSHMADVREVFLAGIRLRRGALLLCLGILACLLLLHRRNPGSRPVLPVLAAGYRRAWRILLLLGGAVAVLAVIDFNQLFIWFHQIFFRQGNWQFDPRQSRMIDIMPEGFFADMALYIALSWAGSLLLLRIAAGLTTHLEKKRRR